MPCSDLGRELDGPCPVPIPADPLCGTSGAIFTLQMVPLCLLHLLQPWESLHTDPEATLSSGQLAMFCLPLPTPRETGIRPFCPGSGLAPPL